MKKISAILLTMIFAMAHLSGQDPTFEKGDKVLNLGIGLGSTLYSGLYYKSQVPPVSASFEIGVVDEILEKGVIGIGPYFGYSSYKWDYLTSGYKYSNLILGARGNFHYPLLDKLDTYTGLLLGFNIRSSKWIGTGTDPQTGTSGGIAWAWFVGGRYYFTESFAAMLELGYGIAYLNLGVALKF